MKKLLLALALLIIVGMAVPLVLVSIPALQNTSALKTMGTVWGCGIGILFLLLAIAALLTQMCPVCGKPVGEEFWMVRYCPYCGTKLRED